MRERDRAVRLKGVGLPTYPGRRVAGLRREEVAQLAAMSVDYYTRLEQGRLTSASEGVVVSLAEALRLSPAEKHYLADLLRPTRRRAADLTARRRVRPGLAALTEGLAQQPAFVLGRGAEVLACNAMLEARQLADRGYDIVGVGASDRILALPDKLPGRHIYPVSIDLAADDGVDQLWARIDEVGRPLDIAVLNAGISLGGSFIDTPIDAERAMIALNITSQILLAKRGFAP